MRQFIPGFLAAAIAVGCFSFTVASPKRALVWYVFIGNPDLESSILDPTWYVAAPSAPSCPAAEDLCAIRVNDGAEVHLSGPYTGKPRVNVAGQLQTDILNATDFDGSSTGQNPAPIVNRVTLKAE